MANIAGQSEGNGNSNHPKSDLQFRSLVAFWLLGLCNNYGYVVMLSAAHDILSRDSEVTNSTVSTTNSSSATETHSPSGRDCNQMSTGAILLADIVPSLVIKIVAPFFPLWIHYRVAVSILLSIFGYVLVGASKVAWVAILGVIATALSSGLGEATLLSYLAFYRNKDVISTWSSGTGGAGFFGSLSYAFLTSIGISPAMTLYGLSSVPILMAFTFWCLLIHPQLNQTARNIPDNKEETCNYRDEVPVQTTQDSFLEKLKYIPNLVRFMLPLGLVYFFEYFINQGLFELVYFNNSSLSHSAQYRWYQVLYQIGVFFSRSSLKLIRIKYLWLLGLLQFINVVYFSLQSVYMIVPSMIFVMVVVLWEGLLGGAAYVNTYHRITIEVPPSKREFSMAITSLADAVGISLAGFLAFPAHNYICDLPVY